MLFATKLRSMGLGTLLPVAFYALVGIVFLALLPFSNFPPHVALTGVLSIAAAFGLYIKRAWASWLVIAIFFVTTVFSVLALYYTLVTDLLVSLGLIAYVVLTWLFTAYVLANRKRFEP